MQASAKCKIAESRPRREGRFSCSFVLHIKNPLFVRCILYTMGGWVSSEISGTEKGLTTNSHELARNGRRGHREHREEEKYEARSARTTADKNPKWFDKLTILNTVEGQIRNSNAQMAKTNGNRGLRRFSGFWPRRHEGTKSSGSG